MLCVLVAATVTGCATTSPPSSMARQLDTTTSVSTTVASESGTAPSATLPAEPDIGTIPEDNEVYAEARNEMVETQIVARGVSDPVVLEAMRTVLRHQFVPAELSNRAYEDRPLPIGYGQTISQPYIVAWMSELLGVEAGAKVLEIGTGSGYQAAVLAEMGVEVYTVEILPELAQTAGPRLQELGYEEVHTLQADGYFGWLEHTPYDAIIVTAAPDHLPQPLLDQLAPSGRMVIPVGPVGSFQTMWRFSLDESGEPLAENLGYVSFVPLTREGPEGVLPPPGRGES